jgi:hypothetical protein
VDPTLSPLCSPSSSRLHATAVALLNISA